jgi:hypothetical protein
MMEIHGRLREEILHIILDSTDTPTNIRMVTQRDLIGRAARKSLPWPTILQFQGLTLIILTI